ncbi:hematological and neurological expressed 1 protein-like [Scleropages formosus]|uniref:Hematological and neurological expressed 1 protein-like n=1 Tax=Scleropages formosus TaxID=113540 RepID=A0A0P7UTH0_SCLFO|nr:jupiter microtubule associated homolog 1-like [Scleropages formosus]KPP62749.1 hematological and neurological expressed 1 protein-like [Scleropages formosus]
MTTTTTFQGMDPGSKNSSRVLRPPGGGSNISFGTDEEKPATRKNKMASSIFAEPEDPHAHRRNNPPGGKPTGVLCGEPSAPLRRCHAQPVVQNNSATEKAATTGDGDNETEVPDKAEEPEPAQEQKEAAAQPSASTPSAGAPGGRRNPPGGKSSLILG